MDPLTDLESMDDTPITLDDDGECVEISFHGENCLGICKVLTTLVVYISLLFSGIYSPISCDKCVVTSIRVAGRQGVWRIEHNEIRAKDEDAR